jgi:hypothetical protein
MKTGDDQLRAQQSQYNAKMMKGKSQIAFTRPSTSKSVSTFDSIRGRNDEK